MLVSDLREIEQRRDTGMDIIYFPELSVRYRGLTRSAAAKDALRCMKTAWTCRMRAAELHLTRVVCG
jgi:hypothetical protein